MIMRLVSDGAIVNSGQALSDVAILSGATISGAAPGYGGETLSYGGETISDVATHSDGAILSGATISSATQGGEH